MIWLQRRIIFRNCEISLEINFLRGKNVNGLSCSAPETREIDKRDDFLIKFSTNSALDHAPIRPLFLIIRELASRNDVFSKN